MGRPAAPAGWSAELVHTTVYPRSARKQKKQLLCLQENTSERAGPKCGPASRGIRRSLALGKLVSPAARGSTGKGFLPMVEVGQTEAALDPCQLLRQDRGRSFRLASHLLTTRLLAALPSGVVPVTPAPTTKLTATSGTPGRHCRHWRGLVHVHQQGHGGREARHHAMQGPKRLGLLGKGSDVLMIVLA
jgi:hypothetical protein